MNRRAEMNQAMAALERKLRSISGVDFRWTERLVRDQTTPEFLRLLLKFGRVETRMIGTPHLRVSVIVVPGIPQYCHDNCRDVLKKHRSWRRYYGFAMSDSHWIIHSWCKKPDGTIVETTQKQEDYFGLPVLDAVGPNGLFIVDTRVGL